MPLLYGEGQKAFLRLREEILRTTSDQSIFAHETTSDNLSKLATVDLWAHNPDGFRDCGPLQV
jgi:hypothetical protein